MTAFTNPLRAELNATGSIYIYRGDLAIGGLVKRFDGTWTSFVNSVGTKLSTKKYQTAEAAALARWKRYGRDAVRDAIGGAK